MPDIQTLSPKFDSKGYAPLKHSLSSHPAMSMSSLRALAHRLNQTEQTRFVIPGAIAVGEFEHTSYSPDGLGLDQVFDQINEPGAWVALFNIETDPQYKAFLDEAREQFEPLLKGQQTGITNVGGFVFISKAAAVTPFHIDRENNFWLQIHGKKTISVWPAHDPEIVAPAAAEKFLLNRDSGDIRINDEINKKRQDYEMGPGDGLYFSSLTPHMTRSDGGAGPSGDSASDADGPSVSIGIVFYTDQTRHHAQAAVFNRLLRLAGLEPQPPLMPTTADDVPFKDRTKAAAGKIMIQLMKRLRGYSPPPGI